jgi:hypothetical protein
VKSVAEVSPDSMAKANILSTQYQSTFSTPREDISSQNVNDIYPCEDCTDGLSEIFVSKENVTKGLVEISGGSFPSPDRVSALCFKNGGDIMVTAVKDILRKSMETGHIPLSLKRTWISPPLER